MKSIVLIQIPTHQTAGALVANTTLSRKLITALNDAIKNRSIKESSH
jgi:hypothetical protein